MKLFTFWKKSSEKKNKESTKKSTKKAAKAARRQAKKETKKEAKAAKQQAMKQEDSAQQSTGCECCRPVQSQRIYFERQISLREKHEEDVRKENLRLQQELLSLTEGTSYLMDTFSEGQQLLISQLSSLLQRLEQWMEQISKTNSSVSSDRVHTERQTPSTSNSEAGHVYPQADSNRPPVQASNQPQIVRPIPIRPQPAQAASISTSPKAQSPVSTAENTSKTLTGHHGYIDPVYLYYYQRYYQYMGTDPDITTQQYTGTYPNSTSGQQHTGTHCSVNTVRPSNMPSSNQQIDSTNPVAYEELLLGRSLLNELNEDSTTMTTNDASNAIANEQPDVRRSRLVAFMNGASHQPPQQQVAARAYPHYDSEQLPSVQQAAHVQSQQLSGDYVAHMNYALHTTQNEAHCSYHQL